MEEFSPQTLTEQQEKKERTPPPRVGSAKVLSVSTAGRPHLEGYGRKIEAAKEERQKPQPHFERGVVQVKTKSVRMNPARATRREVKRNARGACPTAAAPCDRFQVFRVRSQKRSIEGPLLFFHSHLSLASFCFVTARRARFL
ncbi:hypothetical protein HPB48_006941 [Haemaphysalis longicornis]|uniref:Uncharacterized protein n=1 Tax=Haemaphysalis longicornis TaxID=44386 RepID=A0A9J6GFM8_HAELO|nr:hypothetical protein HPB48_006941 [Haemaphysalis longicornis]